MLKVEVIKFEAQDVITASVAGPCGCVWDCIENLWDNKGHADGCQCTHPNEAPHNAKY